MSPQLAEMRDHRNLDAWRLAREVTIGCFNLARDHWRPHAKAALDQVTKASLSVQLNIAEGYALWTPRKKVQHWRTAYGSAVETVDCLGVLRDAGGVPPDECGRLIGLELRVGQMLLRMIRIETAEGEKEP